MCREQTEGGLVQRVYYLAIPREVFNYALINIYAAEKHHGRKMAADGPGTYRAGI